MTAYDFETYPTDPDAMAEYLQEREDAGNPMGREEAEAYVAWSEGRLREMDEATKQADRDGLQRLDEAMGTLFDMEDAKSEVETLLEALEDAERAAQGKRPLKRERDIVTPEGFSGMGVTPRGW